MSEILLGKDKKVVGLVKRKKLSNLIPFQKLESKTKALEMIKWFVDDNIATIAISGNGLICETAVENNP